MNSPVHVTLVMVLSLFTIVPVRAADEGSILRGNERGLEQILRAYTEIPPVQYRPPAERWDKLPKTSKALTEGGTLRVVMLGDSIVNDTSRSCWNFIVERRHPRCRIEKITCVRGSTGCWWYKYPGRVQKFVLDHKPDLVLIGGISHRNDIESIREVIRQIQEASKPDILLMTGAFGATDPRPGRPVAEDLRPRPLQRLPQGLGETRRRSGCGVPGHGGRLGQVRSRFRKRVGIIQAGSCPRQCPRRADPRAYPRQLPLLSGGS